MTTIYFVRHGAYTHKGDLLPFRTPGVHLSTDGKNRAGELKRFFDEKPIAAVYASPIERTVETAKIIAGNRKITVDERLHEVNCPPIPDAISGWDKYDAPWYKKQGGEPIEDIRKRMKDFIAEMVRKHPGQEIIAVSHGDPIMIVHADYAHKNPWDVPYVDMGSIVPLRY